jgi:hypothetical protein
VSSFCATRGLTEKENLSGHSRIAPLTLRYVCVFFRVDAHVFGLCDLLLTSLACLSGSSNFCGDRQRRRFDGKTGPLRAHRIVLVHPDGGKIHPRLGFYQVRRAKTNTAISNNVSNEVEFEHGNWQQRVYRRRSITRPLATTCLPKAKYNTAIGNNVFTEGEVEHGHWQQRVIFVLPTVCALQNLGVFL